MSRTLLTEYVCAANGKDCGKIDLDIATEKFVYGGKDAVLLQCQVIVFTCRACGMAWTDHTAETAREQAVEEHLAKRRGAGSSGMPLDKKA